VPPTGFQKALENESRLFLTRFLGINELGEQELRGLIRFSREHRVGTRLRGAHFSVLLGIAMLFQRPHWSMLVLREPNRNSEQGTEESRLLVVPRKPFLDFTGVCDQLLIRVHDSSPQETSQWV
jgi:hypothetical protein